MNSPDYILEDSNFDFRYVRLCDTPRKMAELFAKSGDPDQTPRSVASDLGLHCLRITVLEFPNYNRLTLSNLTHSG